MGDIATEESHVLTMKTINPRAVEMEYAVRGPIVTRSVNLSKELAAGKEKPFKKVLQANIGDCHATGQNPITFIRQVVAACVCPDLMDTCNFPDDVKNKARRILQGCKGQSVGSYSASPGIDVVRQDIANYIAKRDGQKASSDDVILCTGASDGIKTVLNLLMTGKDGKEKVYSSKRETKDEYKQWLKPYRADRTKCICMSCEKNLRNKQKCDVLFQTVLCC